MKRRTWLKTSAAALAGTAISGRSMAHNKHYSDDPYGRLNYIPDKNYVLDPKLDRIPQKSEEFNESYVFQDEATGRLTRRLTSYRQFNQKPTYHLNDGFSKDNKHLCFATWNPQGGSAMVRVNIETGDCKVIDSTKPGEQQLFRGQGFQMIPDTNLLSMGGIDLVFYDIFTMEKQVVYKNNENDQTKYSRLAGSCDGKIYFTTRNDHDFDYRRDINEKDPFKMAGGSVYTLDINSGSLTEIFRTDKGRVSHVITNPVYPELFLFIVDFPPTYSHGSDEGKTERTYIFNMKTGKATPVKHKNKCKFSWHANWSFDGKHVYYHGPSLNETPEEKAKKDDKAYQWPYKGLKGIEQSHYIGNGEHFIGVGDLNGNVVWEHTYPVCAYGHVSAHTQKNLIIVDNLITYEYLSGIHWDNLNSDGLPMIEILAKHNSTFAPGAQTRHPHTQMTWDGKWMSYNSQFYDKSDVYVVKMD